MAAVDTYRAVDPAPFIAGAAGLASEFGPAPMLQWVKIADLLIDSAYQREIGGSGGKNIRKIAAEFDWSKFATVVIAPIEGGRYAVVDGQHRTTAAAACGIEQVPCQVIVANRQRQAAAFVAINASVTEMSPMQVHAAKIAAQDPGAHRLNKVCSTVGVTICRYPIQSNKMKVGETLAVGALYRALTRFGDTTLQVALSCITCTRDGYPGFIRSPLISALCFVLDAKQDWRDRSDLLETMGTLDLAAAFKQAWNNSTAGSGGGVVGSLAAIITAHLVASHLQKQMPPKGAVGKSTPPVRAANGNPIVDRKSGKVTFGNKSVILAGRPLIIVAAAADRYPKSVDREYLLDHHYEHMKRSGAITQLSSDARIARERIQSIGLDLVSVRDKGFALRGRS